MLHPLQWCVYQHFSYFLQLAVMCDGRWYFPSIMCVRVSLGPPDANGDRPVIIMNRMTPRLHTSIQLKGLNKKVESYS